MLLVGSGLASMAMLARRRRRALAAQNQGQPE
ncbi:MAG: hypothetical protein L0323_09350 [Planctomycetes bacterium]|nr:hypothetical protein [Planctomycetota bacterium]